MRKVLLVIAVAMIILQTNTVQQFLNPPRDFSYLQGSYVTMYSTDWCRYCAKTREFMKQNQIAYKDFDIEKDSQAQREYKALGGGGVPLLVVNQKVIRGYSPALITEYLEQIPKPAN